MLAASTETKNTPPRPWSRRRALIGLTSCGLSAIAGCGGGSDPGPVNSIQQCNVTGIPGAVASINLSAFYQRAAQLQALDLWCWAACISMIFAYRGHPVQQARIVSTAYGGVVDLPAIGITIASALNRTWIDDNGKPFRSTITGLYDAQAGILALTNDMIVNSLQSGTPLLIAGNAHARVLVEVDYQPTPFGASIAGAAVFDPATATTECLSPAEMVPVALGGSLEFMASEVIG